LNANGLFRIADEGWIKYFLSAGESHGAVGMWRL